MADPMLDIDPFDEMAGATIPAPPEPEELPPDVWCLGQVVQQGGSAPKYTKIDYTDKNTGKAAFFYKFECGVRVVGGDGKVKPGHIGRYAFLNANVLPHPEQAEKGAILDGKLQGFLNAAIVPGVADGEKDPAIRANTRYQALLAALRPIYTEQGWNKGTFNNSLPLLLAACAVEWFKQNPSLVLFKTKAGGTYKTKDGEEKKRPTAVGQVEDYLLGNLAKRSVTVMGEDVPPPAGPVVTSF